MAMKILFIVYGLCLLPAVSKYLIINLPDILTWDLSFLSVEQLMFSSAEMHPVVGIKTSLVLVGGTIIQCHRNVTTEIIRLPRS